ncbi:hypothetical protein [Undibacterium umbellatum]|uniref:FeoB-associated Cys-rich membrane protein n=1 Tax=Undibacterium umbellatum TaxID=2762300 RepID=A0ABR6Z2T4_9BURK|nr:hypothetical protein [Undibacterium umbellatum]MBC3906067.1 hypothetical protein [Undibacterium umbellatum]
MQNLIAVLLLTLASAYLLLKWMPAATKEKIRKFSAGRVPALAPLLTKASGQTAGCGGGCSDCSSSSNDTCSTSSELKPVKLIRNASRQG